MRMPELKRFTNPELTRAVANLVRPGFERPGQISVVIPNSSALARHFGRDLFGK
jgi:PST family polysaccharide transporter